jgi:hypothetical protein
MVSEAEVDGVGEVGSRASVVAAGSDEAVGTESDEAAAAAEAVRRGMTTGCLLNANTPLVGVPLLPDEDCLAAGEL